MSDQKTQPEPTRPLPTALPDCDGNFRATAHLSSVECKTRALLKIPSSKVIPVIVIPGIMGSNLCATVDPHKPANRALRPGEAAWRPPNGSVDGLSEAGRWKKRLRNQRQLILDPDTLDVDDTGMIAGPSDGQLAFDPAVAKERGWAMGGLVARACAKRIPDRILGVVHGVMPALGAPVCYRRIACGTETSTPNNVEYGTGNLAIGKFADIAGRTTADTTAVMATASGPLELLPNNLYPKPWLHATLENGDGKRLAHLSLPSGNVYDMYRDTTSWYRMVDPALADPANKFTDPTKVKQNIKKAIDQAERFHTTVLGDYYHPNSYAFYGGDAGHLSFGTCRWHGAKGSAVPAAAVLASGTVVSRNDEEGGRSVKFSNGDTIYFKHSVQDGPGDGTVPLQSGIGPAKGVKQIFCTNGYDHQGSYADSSMLALTLQLIARIAQDAK